MSRSARLWLCVCVGGCSSGYLGPGAVDDVLRRVVDLTLHLDGLLLLVAHFDPEDPEVAASQIQSDEVSLFWWWEGGGGWRGECQLSVPSLKFQYSHPTHRVVTLQTSPEADVHQRSNVP